MRLIYSEPRRELAGALRREFADELKMVGREAGTHVTVLLRDGVRDRDLALRAAKDGLWLAPLSDAYLGENGLQGLMLGFAGTNAREIAYAVSRLRHLFLGMRRERPAPVAV